MLQGVHCLSRKNNVSLSAVNTKKSYQLYYFASCPFCIKTRLQLLLLGVDIPLKNIKRNPLNKKMLIEGGGKNQVPCLRIEQANGDVEWLYESSDIVKYFKAQDILKSQ